MCEIVIGVVIGILFSLYAFLKKGIDSVLAERIKIYKEINVLASNLHFEKHSKENYENAQKELARYYSGHIVFLSDNVRESLMNLTTIYSDDQDRIRETFKCYVELIQHIEKDLNITFVSLVNNLLKKSATLTEKVVPEFPSEKYK